MSPVTIWIGTHPTPTVTALLSLLSLLRIEVARVTSPHEAAVWIAEWVGTTGPSLPGDPPGEHPQRTKIALARAWTRDIPIGWKFLKSPVAMKDVIQIFNQAGIRDLQRGDANSAAAEPVPIRSMQFRLKRWPDLSRGTNGGQTNSLVRVSAFLIQDWRAWADLETFMGITLSEEGPMASFIERCREEGLLVTRPQHAVAAAKPNGSGSPAAAASSLANRLLRSMLWRQTS
jgi:hypothetical protein